MGRLRFLPMAVICTNSRYGGEKIAAGATWGIESSQYFKIPI